MPPDFRAFEVLTRHGVPFVIVGGHAVNYHGHQRATEDADVVWLRSAGSEAALFAALTELNAQYIGNDIDPATGIERTYPVGAAFIASRHLMMLWTDVGFVDRFDHVPGDPQADPVALYETASATAGLRFASLHWVRRMKMAAGRPKDLLDLDELVKLHGPLPE